MPLSPASTLRARFLLAMALPAAAGCGRRAELPVTMTPGGPDVGASAADPAALTAGPPPIEPVELPGQCAAQVCEPPAAPSSAMAAPMPAPFTGCHRVHPLSGAQFSPSRTLATRRVAPATCCYVSFSPCAPSHVVVPGRPLRRRASAAACASAARRQDWSTAASRAV